MNLTASLQSGLLAFGLVLMSVSLTFPLMAQKASPEKLSNYDQAVELYKSGNDAGAIKLLQKVVEVERSHADAWYLLGLASYRSGMLWRAGDAFERVLLLRPTESDERAKVSHAKLAYTSILANESAKAMSHAQRAIELGDLTGEPYYAIAEAKLRAGDHEVAVNRASEALKHDPQFAAALITKGMALFFLNRYPEAVACLADYLARKADDPDAAVWREQLEKIRAFGKAKTPPNATESASPPEDQIFAGRDVTTKARVLAKPEPTYTEAARHAGVTGTVILRAIFSRSGKVTNIFVRQALSYGLNVNAVNAAREIRFVPATKDGKPVSMWMELQYNFNLY